MKDRGKSEGKGAWYVFYVDFRERECVCFTERGMRSGRGSPEKLIIFYYLFI